MSTFSSGFSGWVGLVSSGLTGWGAGTASSLVPTAITSFTGCSVIVFSSTVLVCLPSTVVTSVKIVRLPLAPFWTTLVCPLGKVASFWVIVWNGTTSVEVTTSGFTTDGDFSPSAGVTLVVGVTGVGATSSLVPIAITLSTGCFVIEVLITLLDCLPSTVVTSLNTICSPLTPSWTTLVCPLGRVASACSTVLKGTASVVDLSSGLFSTNVLGATSGVVLYSTLGVGSGWGCVCFGRTFCSGWDNTPKSLSVKYPT